MQWDRKKERWTSRTQNEKAAKMALFRKKKDESPKGGAFDTLPTEVQGQILDGILDVARKTKTILLLIPEESRDACASEFAALLRKAITKGTVALMKGDTDDLAGALSGLELPQFFTQMFLAIRLAIAETPEGETTNGPPRTQTDPTT